MVSFKSIYTNEYQIILVNKEDDAFNVSFKFNCYQLWESSIKSLFRQKSKDFIFLNKDGINLIRFDQLLPRKAFRDKADTQRMIHSLSSMNYQKVEQGNLLYFEHKETDQSTLLRIQQQMKNCSGVTTYHEIFKINLAPMSLQDLILIQSIFLLDTVEEILVLISSQNSKNLFFKSFMELDHNNLVQILSFDSRVTQKLLSNIEIEEDDIIYPLYYKVLQNFNNQVKILTPIEIALKNNQAVGINCMINHILKYQNHYSFSFLFEDIILDLIDKGIKLKSLFESKIFCHTIELPHWPSIHHDSRSLILPYNGSKFDLDRQYKKIYEGKIDLKPVKKEKKQKLYKIKYTLNILPISTYDQDGESKYINDLLTSLGHSEELEMFSSKIVVDYYEFLWNNFAKHIHYLGAFFHMSGAIIFIIYVNEVYLYRKFEYRTYLLYMLVCCKIYPLFYDGLQLVTNGPKEYFKDPWNYIDQAYIVIGLLNISSQRFISDILNPFCVIIMTIQTLLIIQKSFFYIRIFQSMSSIVSMIKQVVVDVGPFMGIYLFMILMLSLLIGFIDWSSFQFDDKQDIRQIREMESTENELYHLPKLVANFISIMRISLGDFHFDSVVYMSPLMNNFYWINFLIICFVTQIIFMNFIIAEVSFSYMIVKETLHSNLMQERGQLINEAEDIIRARYGKERLLQWRHLFPMFIIKRELDE